MLKKNTYTPKCSIVVRCYNEGKHLARLLDGIKAQTYTNWEVIMVDSESTDNTREILENYDLTLITINKEDFTFGYALNVGCEAATGDILVIVSAHVYPMDEHWLENLVAPFADEQVAISYGKQRGDVRNKYSEHRLFERWFPDAISREDQNPFCNNANAAIRTSIWEQKKYDEDLTGLEDVDMAIKVTGRGYTIKYVPEAGIVHVHEEVYSQVYNRYYREAIALRRILPDQNFSLMRCAGLFIANVTMDLIQARKDKVLPEKYQEIFRFRAMQFWGTYRGWKEKDKCKHKKRLQNIYYRPAKIKRETLHAHTQRKAG